MAKKTKAESRLIILLIIIGLPIYGIIKLGESIGWSIFIGVIVVAIILYFSFKLEETKKRRNELMTKYKDATIVDKLMKQSFWQGQTSEQLLDSLGNPEDIDVKILKTKKKEIWKYKHQGSNRYGLRIILDNDLVIGWEQKT